jgi:hypothetical protein
MIVLPKAARLAIAIVVSGIRLHCLAKRRKARF